MYGKGVGDEESNKGVMDGKSVILEAETERNKEKKRRDGEKELDMEQENRSKEKMRYAANEAESE